MFDNLNFQAFLLDPLTAKWVKGIHNLKEFLQTEVSVASGLEDEIDTVWLKQAFNGRILFGLEVV